MSLARLSEVHFEKYGSGIVEAIRISTISGKKYKFIVFRFDTEQTIILPEVELKNYTWYRVIN
jgi:hypothetical protein